MRLVIAAVGRLKDEAERTLFDRYAGRLDGAGRGVALGPLKSIELPESRAADAVLRKVDEAKRLIAAAADCEVRVILDERGKAMSSEQFAKWIAAQRDGGARAAAFLVGGPDGHGPEAQSAATLTLSLGAMTLPHGLARVILAEQLYRAATILSGHPYHRGG